MKIELKKVVTAKKKIIEENIVGIIRKTKIIMAEKLKLKMKQQKQNLKRQNTHAQNRYRQRNCIICAARKKASKKAEKTAMCAVIELL